MKTIAKVCLSFIFSILMVNLSYAKNEEEAPKNKKINYVLIDKSVIGIINNEVESLLYTGVWQYNTSFCKEDLDKMLQKIQKISKSQPTVCVFQNNVAVLIDSQKGCSKIDEENIVKAINMKTNSM